MILIDLIPEPQGLDFVSVIAYLEIIPIKTTIQ